MTAKLKNRQKRQVVSWAFLNSGKIGNHRRRAAAKSAETATNFAAKM